MDQQLCVSGRERYAWKAQIENLLASYQTIVHESYYFKTPEDIAHLLAEACIITVSDCRKGFWHQQLDKDSSFLPTFNTELGRFHYTVMPFEAIVACYVFQCKLDESFGKIEQVIIIADDIIIVGYKPDHSDYDQALTTLLQIAQKCNVKFNTNKTKYFLVKHTTCGYKLSKKSVSYNSNALTYQ